MKINKENDEIWNVNNTLKAHNLSKHGGYATKGILNINNSE